MIDAVSVEVKRDNRPYASFCLNGFSKINIITGVYKTNTLIAIANLDIYNGCYVNIKDKLTVYNSSSIVKQYQDIIATYSKHKFPTLCVDDPDIYFENTDRFNKAMDICKYSNDMQIFMSARRLDFIEYMSDIYKDLCLVRIREIKPREIRSEIMTGAKASKSIKQGLDIRG